MIKFEYIKIMKKSKTRLFINQKILPNKLVYIKEKQHHFLKNVMRCRINDEILILDNITGEWFSRVESINRDNVVLEVLNQNRALKEDQDIWLVFSPIKQYRLNITIQKATELGVKKLIPCKTIFTNNSFLNYKNLNSNIVEAAEQCERLTLPVLEKLITLDELLLNHPSDRGLIFCNEKEKTKESMFKSVNKIKTKFKKWTLLVGPEGGFSDIEIHNIINFSNTFSVSLGKNVLRSDTATTAALYCLQSIVNKDS